MICAIDSCEREAVKRGWCSSHWHRWQKYRDPLVVKQVHVIGSLEQRFWAKVRKTDGCWFWTGGKHVFGYGVIKGRSDQPTLGAHRVSWEIHNGPIPDGAHVLHNCPGGDNPSCVNPAHLWLGSHDDNMQDKVKKGRGGKGERNSRARFSQGQAEQIRVRFNTGGTTKRALAYEYGVSEACMCNLIRGRTYSE